MVIDVLLLRLLRDILGSKYEALWDRTDKRFLVLPVCTVPDKGSNTKLCLYKGEEFDRVLGPPSLVAYRAALLKKNPVLSIDQLTTVNVVRTNKPLIGGKHTDQGLDARDDSARMVHVLSLAGNRTVTTWHEGVPAKMPQGPGNYYSMNGTLWHQVRYWSKETVTLIFRGDPSSARNTIADFKSIEAPTWGEVILCMTPPFVSSLVHDRLTSTSDLLESKEGRVSEHAKLPGHQLQRRTHTFPHTLCDRRTYYTDSRRGSERRQHTRHKRHTHAYTQEHTHAHTHTHTTLTPCCPIMCVYVCVHSVRSHASQASQKAQGD